jgi:hypothetical protein
MADGLAHPLHLPVASLMEDELEHRRPDAPRLGRRRAAVVEIDAVA